MSKNTEQVLIDLTATIESGLNTGIQRVSKEYARNLAEICDSSNSMRFLPVFCRTTLFGRNLIYPIKSIPLNKPNVPLDSTHNLIKFRKWLRQRGVLRKIFFSVSQKKFTSRAYSAIVIRKFQREGLVDAAPLQYIPNQSLLFLDQFWNSTASLNVLEQFKRQGKHYYIFVHDLLPITHPFYFEVKAARHFRNIVPKVLIGADRIFVASDFVKGEIEDLLPNCPLIEKVSLGSDLRENLGEVSDTAYNVQENFLLQVSTLEPRKNHKQVINWYLDSECEEKLVIVGNLGWNSRKLQKFVKESIRISAGKIVWLKDVDDITLQKLLKNSLMGICPSRIEGYDIAMREFLYCGKPVVVSHIPAHTDKSLDLFLEMIYYFDLDNVDSLNSAVMRARASTNKVLQNDSLLNWREAAVELAFSLKK